MNTQSFDEVLPEDAEVSLYAPQLPDSNTSVAGADAVSPRRFTICDRMAQQSLSIRFWVSNPALRSEFM